MLCARSTLALSFVLLPAVAAQQVLPSETAERARVRAIVGDLGLPDLPPAESGPRSSLFFADRLHEPPPAQDSGPSDATLQTITLTGAQTGTGKPEVLWYQLPDGYSASGPPVPMVIAWHGYGSSALSVSTQSTIDDECNARGWIYLSVTGIDDQLFGSPISQDNAEAGILWALGNFNVDEDRLYMVGLSMGGGIVTSFAARHRDPDGLMIAAVGTVSMTGDWTETYSLAPAPQKALMENPFNFGGPPASFPFAYQRVSALYFTPGSYPPAPGTLDPVLSMADNLDATPLWITWDVADPVVENPPAMSAALAGLVQAVGGSAQTHAVSGTPNPHSWGVLDETALFDWLELQAVDRMPLDFHAQAEQDQDISFTSLKQLAANTFTWYVGHSQPAAKAVQLQAVKNAAEISLDAGLAGQSGNWPLRVTARSLDANGYVARLTGFDRPPSYLVNLTTGELVPDVLSDPQTGSLLLTVPGFNTLDVKVVSQNWLGTLSTTPEPAIIGGGVTCNVAMPPGSGPSAFFFVSLGERLTSLAGGKVVTVDIFPPALLLVVELFLAPNGTVNLAGALPADTSLHGLELKMQVVALQGTQVGNITNLWTMHVD